jgi:DNA-binding PadR family transcriptional regulator
MDKRLMVLGLLLNGPLTGYRLYQIAATHRAIYGGLKKANVYYLLTRLESEGLVTLRVEPAAPGPRRERLVYTITAAGRREFRRLLRSVLRDYEPAQLAVEAAAVLIHHVPATEAVAILERRQETVLEHRRQAEEQLSIEPGSAGDLLLAVIDAELGWLARARERIGTAAVPTRRGTV